VILPPFGIYDVESLLFLFDAFLNERQEHPILFIRRVEKGADMAVLSQGRPGKIDRFVCHLNPPLPGTEVFSKVYDAVLILCGRPGYRNWRFFQGSSNEAPPKISYARSTCSMWATPVA
jgi:hypothetical protein